MYLIILKLYILFNTILLTLSSNSDSSLISYDKLKKLFPNLTTSTNSRYTHFLNWVSPSNGSDIRSHPTAVIRCQNQTTCVTPQLQLKRVYNIYYCAHVSYGVRFYFLVKEGLLLHPNVNIVTDPVKADLVFYLPGSADWRKSECNNPTYASKLVVLDEGDSPDIFRPDERENWNVIYFKRSYVRRVNGVFKKYMNYINFEGAGGGGHHKVLPFTYTIGEAYVRTTYKPFKVILI